MNRFTSRGSRLGILLVETSILPILNQSDNAKSQLAKFFRQSGVLLMGDAYMRSPIGCRTGEWANVFSM